MEGLEGQLAAVGRGAAVVVQQDGGTVGGQSDRAAVGAEIADGYGKKDFVNKLIMNDIKL